jgi:hypothetical protein
VGEGGSAGRDGATLSPGSFCLLVLRLDDVDCAVPDGLLSLGAGRFLAGVATGTAGIGVSVVSF